MWGAAPRVRRLCLLVAAIVGALVPGQAAARVDATAAAEATPTFADVPESNPLSPYIEELYARGVTNGCGVNGSGALLFCPLQTVTRQEIAAFLIRAEALPLLEPATATFADVATSHAFFGHIERMGEQGITNGCGVNGTGQPSYCPLNNVTRQEMAAFVVRARGLSALTPSTPTFADVPASHPFYGQIERFYEQGITNGCGVDDAGQRLYCPLSNVTRQEIAAFVVRAFARAPDTTPPSAPKNFRVASRTQTSISVAWNPSTDTFAVTGYGLYRNGSSAGSTPAATRTFTFTGLTCGTTYALAVDATDAAGNRSTQSTLSTPTSACVADTQPPSVPQGLHTASKTQTSVTLAWNASSDNVGVVGYHMYRDNFHAASTPQLTYTFTGLTCGTLYALALEAYDAAGNVSYRPEAVAMVTTNACNPDGDAPTAPTGLATSGITASAITLSWTASGDNVAVTGYGRYANNSLVSSGTGTSYTFTNLACNTTHALGVDAYDAAGNRSTRATVNATTSACPPVGSATVFMSPSGSDTNPCSQAQPCRTFNRAYRVAAPGDTVQVSGGSYGGETIGVDSSKTSPNDVLFRPAAGASVSVSSLNFSGAHIEFRDMTIRSTNFNPSADDITFRNIVSNGMWWVGSSNISIIGGEITCPTCASHPHMQNGGSPLKAPTNILFDGVYFHDWMSQGGEHVECLQILGADNVIIRNSTFRFCGTGNGGLGATASLHLQAYGTGPLPKNILLENNFFYASGNPYVIQGEDFENFDLRYNSIAGPILLYNGPSAGTGMDFVGNVLRASPCTAQNNAAPINWRFNVIQGGTCGSTDLNANSGFVSASSDLHLAVGAAARNAGDPNSYPARDIDGQARPLGGAPDAGADEAG